MKLISVNKNKILSISLIILLFIVIFVGFANENKQEKQISVVFRFDDFSARSSTEIDLSIIDVFRKHNLSISIGVIPFVVEGNNRDPSKQKLLPLPIKKQEILRNGFNDGILDIALHGYSHQTIKSNNIMEFATLDHSSQLKRLTLGQQYLENIIGSSITGFVPPWNRYDFNTLIALEKLNFSFISASKNGFASKESNLKFIPASSNLSELKEAIRSVRQTEEKESLIVVLFHQYDFREVNAKHGYTTVEEFDDLISWLVSQKDTRILSLSDAVNEIKDLDALGFMRMKKIYSLEERFLPVQLRNVESKLFYPPSPNKNQLYFKIAGLYVSLVIITMIIFYYLGSFVLLRSKLWAKSAAIGSILLSTMVVTFLFKDLDVYLNGMLLTSILIGISTGLTTSLLRSKN